MLQPQHFSMVASVVEEISFLETEDVCTEEDDAGVLFVVFEGECMLFKDDEFIKELGMGDYVGEEQIEKNIPADCTVTVSSADAVILAIDKTALSMVTAALQSNN